MHMTFSSAAEIYVTSSQTYGVLPRIYRRKSRIQLAIGLESIGTPASEAEGMDSSKETFKMLFVGRLLCWKGAHLAIQVLAGLLEDGMNVRLTIVGNGPEEPWLRRSAANRGVTQAIEWISSMERSLLIQSYSKYDLFLYPSLHDTGGFVVLESMSHAVPVVCLDLGGPGIIVNDSCGRVVGTNRRVEQEVVQGLKSAVKEILEDKELRLQLGLQSRERARDFHQRELVKKMYGDRNSFSSNE
jgi:glycosyltransferase involved in cell wall biosynthesis